VIANFLYTKSRASRGFFIALVPQEIFKKYLLKISWLTEKMIEF